MATPVKVPPKPTRDPDVHLKGGSRKSPRTLKGDVAGLKERLASTRTKWGEGRRRAEDKRRHIREDAAAILAPAKARITEEKKVASEVATPVYRVIEAVKNGLHPSNGKTRPYVTSFMFSSVLSWAIGPQIFLAAYERIRFGTETTDWGILHGPGRWFRDTMKMAHETDQMGALIWAIILGLAPMIFMGARNVAAGYVAQATYRSRLADAGIKWLTRSAWLVPILYFTGIGYPDQIAWLFGSPWTLEWWQVYVMGLFCMAYYFTMWVFDRIERLNRERQAMPEEERTKSQNMGPGLFHVILMVPLASVVTGALLNTPGAAW